MDILAFLYHHEPADERFGMTHSAGRHLLSGGMKSFLNQNGAFREMSRLSISLNCAWRGINIVDLFHTFAGIYGERQLPKNW